MRLGLLSFIQRVGKLRQLCADQRGVTALEYGLIAAVMVTAIASTIRSISAPVSGAFQRMYDAFF